MARPRRVVVVGGGITGLAAAYFLKQELPGAELELIESRPTLGGNIHTERVGDYLLDAGPDSFLRTKPHAVELCRELGLAGDFIETRPDARKVYLVHGGKLELMPAGMALSVPTRLGPMLKTPILSLWGKLRTLGDLVLEARQGGAGADESIADFVRRRFGREVVDRLAGPLLSGIYAGDVGQLSVWSTFPQLAELEVKHRSVIFGMLASERARLEGAQGQAPSLWEFWRWLNRKEVQAPSPFLSLRRGMGSLIEALAQRLDPERVQLGVRAKGVTAKPDGSWVVEREGGEPRPSDAVVLACPAHQSALLVGDPGASELLSAIPYASTATVFFGLDRSKVQHDLAGVGFIAPKGEAEILASTWVSSKWPHRAPERGALVRAFVGGARSELDVAQASDEELAKLAFSELERLMGPLGEPVFSRVFRYVQSNPQPIVGHKARLARLRDRVSRQPGMELVGAAYEGVGIPDCIKQAKEAALRLAEFLA